MQVPKMIYRLLGPIVGGKSLTRDLPGWQLTAGGQSISYSLDDALDAFILLSQQNRVILQTSAAYSGEWIDWTPAPVTCTVR